jgi:hypothetical protein
VTAAYEQESPGGVAPDNERLSWVEPRGDQGPSAVPTRSPVPLGAAPGLSDPLDPYRERQVGPGNPLPVLRVPAPTDQPVVSYGAQTFGSYAGHPEPARQAAPRIRGFVAAGVQPVRIPEDLAVARQRLAPMTSREWRPRESDPSGPSLRR